MSDQVTVDYDGYVKALEAVHEGVVRDYWAGLLDINRHQVNVARTYLWVSAALIGAYSAVFVRYTAALSHIPNTVLAAATGLLAAIAFGVCLYAIPARKGYRAIPESGWGEFSRQAYDLLKAKNPQVYASFLTEHISKIDYAYAHNFRTNKQRAKLLRFTSWLLIGSFLGSITTAASVIITTGVLHNQEEMSMSGENDSENSVPNAPAPAQPELSVPEPPPPADIGGTDISTHSWKPGSGSTFSMEDCTVKK